MKDKVKSLNSLIAAFETRNELLLEEIKRNKETIEKIEKELILLEDNIVSKKIGDAKIKMVA